MRTMPSGGIIHSSSSAAGQRAEILNDARAAGSLSYSAFIQDKARETGSRSYLVFIGFLAGCFLLSCVIQGWHKQANFQLRPQQMETSLPHADQPVSPQQINSQFYQYGTAYGGTPYVPQSTSYEYGQPDMRVRTNVNR
jgi:hypothetical protein